MKMSQRTPHHFVPGPTYDEMANPTILPAPLRSAAAAARANEMDPLNLFNINWIGSDDKPRCVVLPKCLTRTRANIVVMLGRGFPSGSHKVGPAYATMAESEVLDMVRPDMIMVGPSTGNFGIGTAYVSNLKDYPCLVVMPKGMSLERYERIRKYGGELDLTPGTEADVCLVLDRVMEIRKNPKLFVLAQFELMPNYRFHRHVTGRACLEAVKGVGNGGVAAFVSAPGSAGTLAAADAIKAVHPGAFTVAVEPKECSTLYNAGTGQHRIEGIGDQMVVLIHNVGLTDYVMTIHDDETVKGLKVLHDGAEMLRRTCGEGPWECLAEVIGISGVCNILGAIRTDRHLNLGEDDNIVTIATDGFDRYPSVMTDLERRVGVTITEGMLEDWYGDIYQHYSPDDFLDLRPAAQQQRLFEQKETVWTRYGYTREYLDEMRSQDFWEKEYGRVPEMNDRIKEFRSQHLPPDNDLGL